MKINRAPKAGKVREAIGLDGYAYKKDFTMAPEQPVITKATYNSEKDSLGFIARFEKAKKEFWIDLDDLRSRITDSKLFEQLVSNTNELVGNVKIGFKNGTPLVTAL
jgi:predicted component of type VI protein secretion system